MPVPASIFTVFLCSLVAPASQTSSADLLTQARQILGSCPVDCKPFGADIWLLRKRLASKEELLSMAIQVEQGDEACLCGKTGPSVVEVERQAQLLAEAVLLFHLGQDADAAKLNLGRLRNAAHKSPEHTSISELLLRAVAFTHGSDAAMNEAANLTGALRIHLVVSATLTQSLKPEVKVPLLREALRAWQVYSGSDKELLGRPLMEALEKLSLRQEAEAVAQFSPSLQARLDRIRAAPMPMPPAPPAVVQEAIEVVRNDSPDRALALLQATPKETQAFLLETFGRHLSQAGFLSHLPALSTPLTPPQKLALFIGILKHQTNASTMIVFEDFLQTHTLPKPTP